jgi:hypothetical protein
MTAHWCQWCHTDFPNAGLARNHICPKKRAKFGHTQIPLSGGG